MIITFGSAATSPIPALSSHSLLLFLMQAAVLLLLAFLLGALARRHNLPSIVGELGAGVLLGPSLFGYFFPEAFHWLFPPHLEQFHLLDAVGQVGVLMLVGLSGMALNIGLLQRRGRAAIRISLGGLLIPLALGIVAGYLFPASLIPEGIDRLVFALFIGVAMCVSALPVIAKTLMDMKLMRHRVGQLALSASVIDDMVGWILLAIVASMAATGSVQASSVARSLLSVALVIGFSLTAGRFVVRKILKAARRNSSDDGPLVTAAASLILLSAAVTHALGLEAVFGAFICGILIGSDSNFKSLRLPTVLSVLAPLFFATAGLRIDLTALTNPVVLGSAVIMLLVAIVGKFAGAFLGGRCSKLNARESLAIGAAMNARGVIEILIASVGVRLGILNTQTYTIIVLIAVVTSLAAPPSLRLLLPSRTSKPRTKPPMQGRSNA